MTWIKVGVRPYQTQNQRARYGKSEQDCVWGWVSMSKTKVLTCRGWPKSKYAELGRSQGQS